jgi:alpha-1,2-mannosyltransferase
VPDWLFEFVNPWTTPAALVSAVTFVAWALRVKGKPLAFVALTSAVGVALWQAWKAGPPNGLLDLQIYTNSARAWVNGGSLYDYSDPVFRLSATYPPIGTLPFSVLTPFTADGREVLFTGVSLLALFGCVWSVSGLAQIPKDSRVTWCAWAFTAATVTIPVWLSLRQGQINLLLWFLVLADLEALRRSRRWAGLGIGLATAIKLIPGLFALWLALTRRWAASARALAAFLGATALGWALAPSDSRRYWTELLWESDRVGSVADGRNNSALSIVARFAETGTLRTTIWIIVCAAILAIAALRSLQASRSNDLLAVAAIVGCASAVVSPISWTHHLGFLLVALTAFVVSSKNRTQRVLCFVIWLVLIDPGGHGDDPLMSTLRGLLLIGAVCLTPIRYVDALPYSERSIPSEGQNQTATTPRTRATKSALPSSSLFRRIAIPPTTFAPRS